MEQTIWLNSNLRRGKHWFSVINKLYNAGIVKIKDVVNERNNRFLNVQELSIKYCVNVPWLWYANLLDSIPNIWKMLLQDEEEEFLSPPRINLVFLNSKTKASAFIYNFCIENFCYTPITKYLVKWEGILNVNIEFQEYFQCFKNLYCITDITKY